MLRALIILNIKIKFAPVLN